MTAILSSVLLSLLFGIGLGLISFTGLWLTVQCLPSARCPALWMGASIVTRMAIVLCGFFFVSGSSWQALTWSLAGFILARETLIRRVRHLGPGDRE